MNENTDLERYRLLFANMLEGVAIHELIYDSDEKAIDYKIIDVNPAFETITDIKSQDAKGAIASKLYGIAPPPYLVEYSEVVSTGTPYQFTTYFDKMDKHFAISVFTPQKDQFVTIFTDITEQVKTAESLQAKVDELTHVNELMVNRELKMVEMKEQMEALGAKQ